MRFYTRNPQGMFHSAADSANWEACNKALKTLPTHEQGVLVELYRRKDKMPSNVILMANRTGMTQEAIWKLVAAFEKRVAQERGLV